MLGEAQQEQLVRLLVATAEVVGDEIRPAAAALMVDDLSSYPMPALQAALTACRRELKGRLSLAAILERIDDGHPSPNQAWAMAALAADERNTVVWTSEMQAAWSVALPLADAGDMIGARMAFLETYAKAVKDARAEQRPASYTYSLGFDASGRDSVLRQAVARGLLQHEAVSQHLRIAAPAATPFNPVALLNGKVEAAPGVSPDIKRRLDELRAALEGP
ncbi:hypothetical protein [Xanthomonas sacchari]|uniref:hypothetical protein n=1 Tax=Xanthomonas sacchari TaxID=56458 RepID=UPI0022586325|nr:hypothetical protein [Xanthomonas sacchari]MCW0370251.1 hypothetical protein [Xanthomonas sacchari]